MLDWALNTPLDCQSNIFSNYNDRSTNVLNQKTLMSKFFVHIEIIMALKTAVGGGSLQIPRK